MRRTFSADRRPRFLSGRMLLLLAMALVLVALLAPSFMMPGVRAAAVDGDGAQKVAAFEDVTVVAGEVRDNLVVVGGDVVIHGTVQNVVVVVGGDLVVASDGTVGTARSDDNTVIVSVFGSVDIEQGAKVAGRVVDVSGGGSAPLDAMVVDPVTRPWSDWNSIAGWIGSTVFILLVAVIVAAVAPRQLAVVSERARRHVFSSLGWGALGLIVLLPLATIVLIFTLVGILALLPFWLAVAIALLFGYAAVGALIGRLVLGRGEGRGKVILAAVFGVGVLCIVRWIPFFGSLVVFCALLIGLGATVTGLWEARHLRKQGAGAMPLPSYPPAPEPWVPREQPPGDVSPPPGN
jgi:hypothetical protein